MPRIRIVQPGWTNYTGDLHNVAFTNGVSTLDLDQVKAQQLAANFLVEDYAVAGVRYGDVLGIVPLSREAAPSEHNTPGVVTDLEAAIDALSARVEALETPAE